MIVAAKTRPEEANPARASLRKEQKKQRAAERRHGKDAELDRALADTFPASDPVALETPTKSGAREPG